MHTKAMSTGFSRASCCASVTCKARTETENSGTSRAWVTRRPCFLKCSTCSGHGSMNVTSSPACTICAPAYPPTAPAPTIAIFWPIRFLALLRYFFLAKPSAPAGLVTMDEREWQEHVGWRKRLVRRSSKSECGSDTHYFQPDCPRWVSLALNPSYKLSLAGAQQANDSPAGHRQVLL